MIGFYTKQYNWDDREDSFCPCDYCAVTAAQELHPAKDITDVCQRCDYNIVLYCLRHDV